MFLMKLPQTQSGFPCRSSLRSKLKKFVKPVISAGLALTAALCSGYVSAQTLVLTKTPAVTDLYSRGVVAFPSTDVGTNSAVQNLRLTVTGGALTITSITVPTSTIRIQQFTVGAITGCTVNGTTSNPTGTVCTVPVTFNPAYVGYQTSPLVAVTSNGTFQFGLNGVGLGPQAILLPGILSTIAGNGTVQATPTRYTGDGGQATAAQVLSHGFAFDALGNIYEAEYNASVIRRITPDGVINTVIGAETTTAGVEQSTQCTTPTTNGTCGDGGAVATANFGTNLPDIALDSAGDFYIADSIDNRIRRVDVGTNIINTIAGTGSASTTGSGNTGDGGAATAAQLNTPEAVMIDNADNIYMLNSNASQQTLGAVVRFISSATGTISTLAGTGAACVGTAACGDGGQSTAAQLAVSAAFYVDPTTGNIWIADRDDDRIRFINRSTGIISTVAGTGAAGYTGDGGPATAATFNGPHGIWVDPAGNLYISDRNNNVVRYVSKSTGIISTVAGGGAACAAGGNGTCGDGGLSNGPLANLTPDDIRFDVNGNIYVADQANNAIRKITTSPSITLTFPTVPVGTTSGPLTATLQNIGTSTLTYTTPASGTNAAISTTGPTALPSNAFAQTNATTCGPISSTSTTGNTLASGASCNFVVSFTPDTSVGNYTGTLIETDNSLNSGAGNTHYPTALTQTVNLQGAATAQTATVTLASTPNPSTYGASVAFTATVGGVGVAPTGTVTFSYTPTGSTTAQTIGTGTLQTANGVTTASINYALLPVGTDNIIATYGGDGNYAAGTKSAADAQVVGKAPGSVDTLTAAPTASTYGTNVLLTFTVPTTAGATAPTGTVTFTSGGVTLGTGTISTAGGVSTATLTTSKLPVGTDTVTATYPGDANYGNAAPTATETVSKAPGTGDTLTANPTSSTFGSPVVLTFTVPTVAGAATSPTGTVTFTNGTTTLGTGTLTTTGTGATAVTTATLTTSVLPTGTDTITGTYPGDTNYAAAAPTATETVSAAPGTYTLTGNPPNTTFGAPVILTFTVPLVNGVAPTGTVTFKNGTTILGTGTLNASGVATLTTTALPVGTDTVTGTYPGDANYATGTATTTETIGKADPGNADTLTANPTTSAFGSPVVLTFTVPTIAGATASPTGTVTFTQGTTTLGTGTLTTTGTGATAVTTATLTTSALPVGTDTVIATYPGDANYSNAAPTATETVTKATPTDTLAYSPSAPTYGSPVVLTFTIPPVAGATATPTGTVTFTNGGTQLGTGTISTVGGVTTATITTTALPVGSDTVTATYGGDTNYAAAAPTAVVPVGKADGGNVDTLTATPSPSTYGAPVLLTFNIPTVAGAVMPPTGTVTFTSGGVTLGTGTLSTTGTGANAVTTATLTTSALPVGTDTITATYPGDTNYAASAPTTTETINKSPFGAPNDTLTTNPNPSTFGQTVTLTETLTTVGALAPTGSVTFFYNGASIGTGTITGGVASVTIATLPVGTDPITATYTGDGNYAAGTSGPVNQVVNQAVSQATLAVGPNPATFGTPVTLTESIAPINGSCPAGPTTFLNNGVSIGTAPITLTNGSCVATLTSSTLPVGTDQITATVPASGGFVATTTGPVALVVNKANGADTLTSSPNPSVFGSAVTITDTIPTVGGIAPTGTVTFFDFGVQIGTGTVNAQGVATLVTSTLPVGTDSLTATYSGDANYAQVTAGPVNQVVTAVATSPTLAVGPNPTTFGTTVTFTETIPTTNNTPATGQVLFYQSGKLVGAGTLVNGVATITTSTLPVGTDPITATYAGDANYSAANSGPVNEVINKANGPDTLAVSPDPAVFGSTVTMTDTIPTVGGVAPTGTVTFYNNGVVIGTSPVSTSGVATLTSTTLPVGSNPITAIYSGDTNYASVTAGPVNEVITVGNTTPVLAASPNPSTFGTPVTLTESIPGINGVSPTGSVTFFNNGTAIGTAPVTNGVATLVTSTLPIGTDPITAKYTGDSNYATATSGPLNVVVNRAAPTDTLTALPSPSNFGSTVTLTFTVPPVNGVAPTGIVSFYNGTTLIGTGTVNAQGVATLPISTLPVGTDTITAKYPGDNNYAPASPTATVVINQALPTATLVAGPNPATFGTPVTLTESIAPINGTCPAGPTTFLNNGVSIGTAPITLTNGSCVATLTSSTLPVGTDQITATVPASGGFVATTTGPVALVVNKANGADTLTSSPNPSVFGSAVTITDTIPTVGGIAPTGTVTFFDFGVQIGTGTVNAQGVATLVTSTLPVGTDSLTATYGGDANYAQVTAGPVNQVVTAVATSPTLAVGPNPTTFGTTVTFTETIPTTNNTPATGTVIFSQHGIQVGTGTLVNGVATITTSTLPVGTDPITATYAGDANYAAANSGPVNEVVNKATGPTTLTVSPDPSPFGNTVTMTDTIPTVGGVAPTGTVTFYNNGASIGTGTVNAQGVATLTSTTLPVGSDPITAIYGGDNNYATSTAGPVNEIITQTGTLPVLGATPNPATFGTTVTLTEAIPGVNGISPTGTVSFYNNGALLGNAPVTNGVATLPTSTLPIGTDPITAIYSGDSNYSTANSGPLNVVITKVPSPDSVTVSPNPSTFGSPVTITFTVPPVNGVVPTGTVQFFDGNTLIGTGTVNAQGVATLTTSQLPYGTSTVTAKYPGDNTYAPASPTATATVNPVIPTSIVTVPAGSPICGSSVTLTDTITLVNGVALGGTVQFYDNGTAIGSPVPVPASGVVTLTTTSLPCTTDIITAIYTPPANSPYLPSTGGPTTVVVNSPDFSIAATPPNQTVNPGDTTTYTVSLSGVGLPFTSPVTLTATGLPPGATVSFANGTYVPGQGPTSTTMTIVTAPNQAVLKHSNGSNGIYYGLLLLPLLGLGKVRRKIKALPKGITYCLAALIMLGGLGAMTGCGGGYFGPAPQTFTITVTGTSGTLVHSTTVTLTVR